MKPHLEVLESGQRAVMERMAAPMEDEGFYLGGGTAIALHLGHRKSIDLDWFTNEKIDDPLRLVARVRDADITIEEARTDKGTVHGKIDGVRLRLFEYRYPLLGPVTRLEGSGVPIAALDDFDDADAEQPPTMLRDTDWEAVKADFRRWIREL